MKRIWETRIDAEYYYGTVGWQETEGWSARIYTHNDELDWEGRYAIGLIAYCVVVWKVAVRHGTLTDRPLDVEDQPEKY